MELRQDHAPFRLAERLVEIIEQVGDGADDVDALREDLEKLRPWIGLVSLRPQGANQLLAEQSRARSLA